MNQARRGRPRGQKKAPTLVRMTPAAKEAVQKAAFRRNRSVSQLFEDFVRQECAQFLPTEEAAPAVRATA